MKELTQGPKLREIADNVKASECQLFMGFKGIHVYSSGVGHEEKI
ncbi:hypothetical protein [Mahella australiensis]|nr:hypothetical protein [Mahella australiensis]